LDIALIAIAANSCVVSQNILNALVESQISALCNLNLPVNRFISEAVVANLLAASICNAVFVSNSEFAELNALLNVHESKAKARNAALVLTLAHNNSSIVRTAKSHSFCNH